MYRSSCVQKTSSILPMTPVLMASTMLLAFVVALTGTR